MVKNPPANAGDVGDSGSIPGSGRSPGEEILATHSSILAWRIPWTEEPGRLQSMRSQRVRHDWATEHACSENEVILPAVAILSPSSSFIHSTHDFPFNYICTVNVSVSLNKWWPLSSVYSLLLNDNIFKRMLTLFSAEEHFFIRDTCMSFTSFGW